jgi:hypothetical protein
MLGKASSANIRAAFFYGKYLDRSYQLEPDQWEDNVRQNLGISKSHAYRFRTMWTSLSSFPIFQRLTIARHTLSVHAHIIQRYLQQNNKEAKRWNAFWSGTLPGGPEPWGNGRDKGKQKETEPLAGAQAESGTPSAPAETPQEGEESETPPTPPTAPSATQGKPPPTPPKAPSATQSKPPPTPPKALTSAQKPKTTSTPPKPSQVGTNGKSKHSSRQPASQTDAEDI